MQIPKIIHQVWGGDQPFPSVFKKLSESWQEQYTDWKYILWNDAAIDDFIMAYYPQYHTPFHSFPYNIQRWDAIRYLLLNLLGGLYADVDYESIKPMDELIGDHDCCFASEPDEHGGFFENNRVITNALMLCSPQHQFISKVIQAMFSADYQNVILQRANQFDNENRKKIFQIHYSTGPGLLIDLYGQLSDTEKEDIFLIPAKYVTPLTNNQAQRLIANLPDEEMEARIEEAYAVHYFFTTWITEINTNNHKYEDNS